MCLALYFMDIQTCVVIDVKAWERFRLNPYPSQWEREEMGLLYFLRAKDKPRTRFPRHRHRPWAPCPVYPTPCPRYPTTSRSISAIGRLSDREEVISITRRRSSKI